MTTIHDGKIDRSRNLADRIGHWRQRLADLDFRVALTMQLWSARHHRRQELAEMSDRDLKDGRVAPDLVAHEVRKWRGKSGTRSGKRWTRCCFVLSPRAAAGFEPTRRGY